MAQTQWSIRAFIIRRAGHNDHAIHLQGRTRWALEELIKAGPQGCTPITHPGPRWSAYVFNLRAEGVRVQTITENHAGPFAGHHARYVLRDSVTPAGQGGAA